MKKILILSVSLFLNYSLFSQIPNNPIDVQNYNISLDFTDMNNENISGNTIVSLKISKNNTNSFGLELLKLTIDSIKCSNDYQFNYSYNDTVINFIFENDFNENDEISLAIYYHGHPLLGGNSFGGFYFTNGYAFNMGVSLYDIPHNYSKVWFPCNDNFTDRASYDFQIKTPADKMAVCGGELINEIDLGTSKVYEWKLEEEIPTYLASVAVAGFQCYNSTYQGIEREIPISVYAVSINNVANSFKNLNSALSIFEENFGAYRWNRVGYVIVPFNAGAMEHATNIAIGTALVNGGTTYEDVFFHELAHNWFGNLITCRSAEDMWINEGFTSYCETIFREFHYGKENAKNYRRSSHLSVVKDLSFQDGDFLALSPMSQDLTYSQTVYEKGASVAHALRGYLGDDLFFEGMKVFFAQKAFSDVSSEDIRNFLTDFSGIDLTDFFNDWVFTGGFVHYEIDSVVPLSSFSENSSMKVYVHQKLRGRENFANSNRVELSFMNASYNIITKIIEFDGEYGEQVFEFNGFFPIAVFCDLNEKLSDATFDSYKFVKTTGVINFPSTNTYITVTDIPANDSVFIRVTHNLVSPDNFKNPIPGLAIVKSRYWTIEGIFPEENFNAKADFSFNTTASNHLDYGFINNVIDSMVLLYRPNKYSDWQIADAIFSNNLKKFTVNTLKIGEYCFGIYDWQQFDISKIIQNDEIIVYPNPAENHINISFPNNEKHTIKIFNLEGKNIFIKKLNSDTTIINTDNFKSGVYLIEIQNSKNKVVKKQRIIIRND